MASASQSASISRLQVGDIFVKTYDNIPVPKSYLLVSNGGGTTRWDNISSVFPVSSFKTIRADDGSTFSADLSYNVLNISTTAIPSTFRSYIDPVTSSLMLSLAFPPIVVNNGSVTNVTTTYVVPNPSVISSLSLQSTIRFYGVNDILLSTITTDNSTQAVYISISSFTSAAYSTLNGEMINYPKVSVSSFSTSMGQGRSQNFTSSIPFTNVFSSASPLSTVGVDSYMSSIIFDGSHITNYVNQSSGATSATIEFFPNYEFPALSTTVAGSYDSDFLIKPVVSYLQIQTGTSPYIFSESSNVRYIYSQNLNGSNYFTDTIKMRVNPYTISSYVGSNLPLSTPLILYQSILSTVCINDCVGFSTPTIKNRGIGTNSLFLTINNQATLPPVRQ